MPDLRLLPCAEPVFLTDGNRLARPDHHGNIERSESPWLASGVYQMTEVDEIAPSRRFLFGGQSQSDVIRGPPRRHDLAEMPGRT